MYEPHDLTSSDDDFTARLRAARPASPRLDRDRLMYLAGQQSVIAARRNRALWPTLTVASWAACAVLVGLAFARPPVVVTNTKIVERVVEVPTVADAIEPEPEPDVAPRVTADASSTPPANTEPPFDLAFLDDLHRPLTALASRPELFGKATRPVSVASVEPPAVAAEPKKPQTYAELRRELLGTVPRSAIPGPLKWF